MIPSHFKIEILANVYLWVLLDGKGLREKLRVSFPESILRNKSKDDKHVPFNATIYFWLTEERELSLLNCIKLINNVYLLAYA